MLLDKNDIIEIKMQKNLYTFKDKLPYAKEKKRSEPI